MRNTATTKLTWMEIQEKYSYRRNKVTSYQLPSSMYCNRHSFIKKCKELGISYKKGFALAKKLNPIRFEDMGVITKNDADRSWSHNRPTYTCTSTPTNETFMVDGFKVVVRQPISFNRPFGNKIYYFVI